MAPLGQFSTRISTCIFHVGVPSYLQEHPAGSSVNLDCFEHFNQFWLGFTMVVYKNIYIYIYLEAKINNGYILPKTIFTVIIFYIKFTEFGLHLDFSVD